jgi:hypothetical protein
MRQSECRENYNGDDSRHATITNPRAVDKTILASFWIGFGSELIGSLSFIDAEIKGHDLAMGVDASSVKV